MSDVAEKRAGRTLRRQRSIYQVHYSLRPREDDTMAKPWPPVFDTGEVKAYELQVAGHQNAPTDTKYLGLLQCSKGRILKPILKAEQRREVEFYKCLASTADPDLMELRKFTPKYYGCQKFTYNGYEQEYIILEDLTERMLEPCIMDVKIGRKTWGQFATEEKIKSEQSKYKLCKEEFGFCIPGYQVFKVATGKLQKYNKEYGKKLPASMVVTAFRNFLNSVGASLCRALVVRLLTPLWRLQRWAARPRALRLRAASLLLVYDAARLRSAAPSPGGLRSAPVARRKSIHSMHSPAADSDFSGQLSAKGPVYKKVAPVPLTPLTVAQASFSSPPPIKSPWSEALEKLNQNHSFEHNYEDKLSKIKMNYRAMLDQLASDGPSPNPWGTVRVIDFAHAYFSDPADPSADPGVDDNFKEGIDNLVEIFESLLRETEDQVF